MGGPNKLLLPYGKSTVIGTVVQTLLSCGLGVVVVTGRDADEVARAAEPARCVFNPSFESGLGSSIACGVKAAPPGGVLIALGDMPGLRKSVVEELVASLDDERKIIAPVYNEQAERRGHPVLFGAKHREALMALSGDEGANSVVLNNTGWLDLVCVDGGLGDIDAVSDL